MTLINAVSFHYRILDSDPLKKSKNVFFLFAYLIVLYVYLVHAFTSMHCCIPCSAGAE
jgi:hypothetical protein